MSDLARFLLDRTTEDEAKVEYMRREAHRAATAPVFALNPIGWLAGVDIFVNPDRWAAECAAKKRIIGRHSLIPPGADIEGCYECHDEWPCATLKLLAEPYRSHPSFDASWLLP